MPANQCPSGHAIRSSADRDGQGFCRLCRVERSRRRRVSDSMKLSIARAFEDAGVRFEDDDGLAVTPAEVVRQLAAVYEAGAL